MRLGFQLSYDYPSGYRVTGLVHAKRIVISTACRTWNPKHSPRAHEHSSTELAQPRYCRTRANPSRCGRLPLLPSRPDLVRKRLEAQRQLIKSKCTRSTPILVTPAGIIYDGHHAVRAAAEEAVNVSIKIIDQPLVPRAASILDLPVR